MEEKIFKSIVIDNGSGMTKCGFSKDEFPTSVFPTVVGRPDNNHRFIFHNSKIDTKCFFGNEAKTKSVKDGVNKLILCNPIEYGVVTNWKAMEQLWEHIFFSELKVSNTKEHPVLLTEAPLTEKRDSEKSMAIMFENFNVPELYLGNQSILSLYASGRTSGVSVDSGDGTTNVIPIFEGNILPNTSGRMYLAGKDVTDYLKRLLSEKKCIINDESIVKDIKEKLCYVSDDYKMELSIAKSLPNSGVKYELPDGTKMKIGGSERIQAAEIMFQPFLAKSVEMGLHEIINSSINKCNIHKRKELYCNIVLSGGNTMMEGMKGRLLKEMRKKTLSRVKIIAPPERMISAWMGGQVLCSLHTFVWIKRNEYMEVGENILKKKSKAS